MTFQRKFELTDTWVCKGLAIIFMLIHHLFADTETCKKYRIIFSPLSQTVVFDIAKICVICVAIFVFLTAYGITKKYGQNGDICKDGGGKSYLVIRLSKLMCGYVFIYILSQIISYFTPRTRVAVYGEDFVKRMYYTFVDLCGLANIYSRPTYNMTWWYMELAILLILIMPFICRMVDRVGGWTIIIMYLIPLIMHFSFPGRFWNYILTAFLGTICAKEDIFERLSSYFGEKIWIKFVKILIALGIIAIMSILFLKRENIENLTDPIMSVTICWLGFELFSRTPFIGKCLAFIGKHSMNIFLTHTFIYYYFGERYIYSFRYFVLLIVVLLVSSLLLSIIIEELKKGLRVLWVHMSKKKISLMSRH